MQKNNLLIKASSVSKKYTGRTLFKDISLSIKACESLAITGHNGSGKSTLLKILSGISRPDKGSVQFTDSDSCISSEDLYKYIGFSSPEINPYDELTGYENIAFALKDKTPFPEKLIADFNLTDHINKRVKLYSTGMKQRLKLILALSRDPVALFLDEPGSNLDTDGKKIMRTVINKKKKDMIIIIATNEADEANLCSRVISLDE